MSDMRDKLAQIISDERFYGGPQHVADAILKALPDLVEPLAGKIAVEMEVHAAIGTTTKSKEDAIRSAIMSAFGIPATG